MTNLSKIQVGNIDSFSNPLGIFSSIMESLQKQKNILRIGEEDEKK